MQKKLQRCFPWLKQAKQNHFPFHDFSLFISCAVFSSQPIYLVKIQLQLYKLHNSCYILQYIPIIYTVIFQAVGGSATVPSETIGTARQIHLFMLYTKDMRVFFLFVCFYQKLDVKREFRNSAPISWCLHLYVFKQHKTETFVSDHPFFLFQQKYRSW